MDAQKAQLIDSFLADCRVRNFTKNSIQAYKSHVCFFLSLYSVNASRQDLSDFLVLIRDTKGRSASTVQNYFISLSTFYEFLRYEDIVTENPIPAFRTRYIRS